MAVNFDRTILSAPEAVIFGSVQVVFFYCPFLDYLNHGVTTVTVGVTSFTNHSVHRHDTIFMHHVICVKMTVSLFFPFIFTACLLKSCVT